MVRFRFLGASVLLACLLTHPFTSLAQSESGIITSVAGATEIDTGPLRGFSGDIGPARQALLSLTNLQNDCDPNRFEQISHIALAPSGDLYVSDSANQRIRVVNSQGIIRTFAGNGERPPTDSRTCVPTGGAAAIGDGGAASAARLFYPAGIAIHPNGSLIIADQQNNRIRQISSDGVITTIAGNGLHSFYAPQVPATSSGLDWPTAVAVSASGEVFFSELHSGRVARIAPDGRLVTVAGTGIPGFNGNSGTATSVRLLNPTGIAFDVDGNLYIADQGNHRVRKVSPNGFLTTIAGGNEGFAGDGGLAVGAQLDRPADVKADRAGNIYVSDMNNHRVRKIDSSGIITTVAGNGLAARGPDGVPAQTSSLAFPTGLAVAENGDLFIVDWNNYLIRKVSTLPEPAIYSGGIVNAASFAAGVAPGSIFSIFGVNLAASTASITQVPLPTELAGTSVRVNGQLAPLYFVSSGQINAQLPYDVAAGRSSVSVMTPQGTSATENVTVAASSIGMFVYPSSNRALALNQDNTLNSAETPESRGRVITVFITGIGRVSPDIGSGDAAVMGQLNRAVANVSATLGGVAAEVQFSGLTPGFVGLAQANVAIPQGSPTGDEVPLVLQAAGQSSKIAFVSVR